LSAAPDKASLGARTQTVRGTHGYSITFQRKQENRSMSAMLRTWNPWRELNRLRSELDRSAWPERFVAASTQRTFPQLNAWQSKETLILTAEIPGLDMEKLDLTVKPDSLTLSGARSDAEPKPGETYLRRERRSEPFHREVELPFEVDPQQTEATYEKGVLTITLHRPAEHKPKKVTIKAG